MKKILSKFRELPHAFQGFVSLSGLNGPEFAPFLTAAFNSQNFPTFVNALFKEQFTQPPAQNSFFGGAGGQFDPSLNGVGVSGNEIGNPNPSSP
ncbi:MAG: hypothetical protein G01um10148_106 [Parcubacteria group bacterium Gr01-1014_8]|nr:MAG: hypothetical protein G01um10148_106 [Parcubacteria group bacterium Gr01-1014_8]